MPWKYFSRFFWRHVPVGEECIVSEERRVSNFHVVVEVESRASNLPDTEDQMLREIQEKRLHSNSLEN